MYIFLSENDTLQVSEIATGGTGIAKVVEYLEEI